MLEGMLLLHPSLAVDAPSMEYMSLHSEWYYELVSTDAPWSVSNPAWPQLLHPAAMNGFLLPLRWHDALDLHQAYASPQLPNYRTQLHDTYLAPPQN